MCEKMEEVEGEGVDGAQYWIARMGLEADAVHAFCTAESFRCITSGIVRGYSPIQHIVPAAIMRGVILGYMLAHKEEYISDER